MNAQYLALAAGLCILPLIVGGGMFFNSVRDDRRLAGRFAGLHRPLRGVAAGDPATVDSVRTIAIRFVSSIGDQVLRLGLLSERTRNDLEATLRDGGQTGSSALRVFVGTKIILMVGLPAAMWVVTNELQAVSSTQAIACAVSVIVGLVAPDMIVRKLRTAYMTKIRNEIPDALDLMVICAQAGLGMGTSIVRVAQELRFSHRAIALELARTANELQMMTDSKVPLTNLGNRCGVESARRLATTLLQSAQYGTPLTEALRGLAAELRTELITRFEARAARLSVLLTLPMIVFNLPCVFLVIGGPAVTGVVHAFS